MRERLHHMIFYRRNADSQLLVNVAIAEFLDAVHQKNALGLARHGFDGLFVQSEEVRCFQTLFLLRRTGSVMFLFEGEHDDIVALPTAGTVNEQILRDTMQESRRVGETMTLRASSGAREHILHQIRCGVASDTAVKETQQSGAMAAKYIVEAGNSCRGQDTWIGILCGPVVTS